MIKIMSVSVGMLGMSLFTTSAGFAATDPLSQANAALKASVKAEHQRQLKASADSLYEMTQDAAARAQGYDLHMHLGLYEIRVPLTFKMLIEPVEQPWNSTVIRGGDIAWVKELADQAGDPKEIISHLASADKALRARLTDLSYITTNPEASGITAEERRLAIEFAIEMEQKIRNILKQIDQVSQLANQLATAGG